MPYSNVPRKLAGSLGRGEGPKSHTTRWRHFILSLILLLTLAPKLSPLNDSSTIYSHTSPAQFEHSFQSSWQQPQPNLLHFLSSQASPESSGIRYGVTPYLTTLGQPRPGTERGAGAPDAFRSPTRIMTPTTMCTISTSSSATTCWTISGSR